MRREEREDHSRVCSLYLGFTGADQSLFSLSFTVSPKQLHAHTEAVSPFIHLCICLSTIRFGVSHVSNWAWHTFCFTENSTTSRSISVIPSQVASLLPWPVDRQRLSSVHLFDSITHTHIHTHTHTHTYIRRKSKYSFTTATASKASLKTTIATVTTSKSNINNINSISQ